MWVRSTLCWKVRLRVLCRAYPRMFGKAGEGPRAAALETGVRQGGSVRAQGETMGDEGGEVSAIVCDNGSGMVKVGAGDCHPSRHFN